MCCTDFQLRKSWILSPSEQSMSFRYGVCMFSPCFSGVLTTVQKHATRIIRDAELSYKYLDTTM